MPGQEFYIFFDSGLDVAPVETQVVSCDFDLCLLGTAETLSLVRVSGGWQGRMGGRPLTLHDNGAGVWGGNPASSILVSWKVPPV